MDILYQTNRVGKTLNYTGAARAFFPGGLDYVESNDVTDLYRRALNILRAAGISREEPYWTEFINLLLSYKWKEARDKFYQIVGGRRIGKAKERQFISILDSLEERKSLRRTK